MVAKYMSAEVIALCRLLVAFSKAQTLRGAGQKRRLMPDPFPTELAFSDFSSSQRTP